MNTCPNCGFQNPEEIHICLRCAAALNRVCPQCGAEVPSTNRFCGQCGQRIQLEPAPASMVDSSTTLDAKDHMLRGLRDKMPAALAAKIAEKSTEMLGQRREVTVLFVDLQHQGQAAPAIDGESLYLATEELMGLLAELVYKYEGTIDRFTGSGMMAIFGIPLNHENDPERAVRAALEFQAQLQPRNLSLLERFRMIFTCHTGINTGSVIVGSFDLHQHLEYTVIGDTINLAATLRDRAQTNTILTSFSTYQRTRPIFNFQAMPPLESGEGEPSVQVFQPREVRLRPDRMRGLPGLQVPMVGRSEDLKTLKEAFNQIRSQNQSQIVLISGEAGIGKTRLVAEFRNLLAGQGARVYQGTCAVYMRITPYRVVADIIRTLLHVSELDPEPVQRETLRQHLEHLGLDLHDSFPYLLQVLGLPLSDPVMELRVKLLEPAMLQRQTQVVLRQLLLAEADLAPTVLVFDDLHWVDQASQQFLEFFSQSLEENPILLVFVARNFILHPPALAIQTAVQKHSRAPLELPLAVLSPDDSRQLVDQLIIENDYRAEQLKAAILQRAGGNPYYTEELVRVLIDEAALEYHTEGWRINLRAIQLINQVPGTLQDIILARFDLLPVEQQHVLQIAAVIGEYFDFDLLQSVSKFDTTVVLDCLEQLKHREFLVPAWLEDKDGFQFKHPIVRESIYNTLLKRDLQNIHYRIAQVVERGNHWLPGERMEFLAMHYAESHEPQKAIQYLLSAAEKASHNFANESVVILSRKALEIINTDGSYPDTVHDRVRIILASALKFMGEFAEGADLLLKVIDQQELHLTQSVEPAEVHLILYLEALRELADIRALEGALEIAVQLLQRGLDFLGEKDRADHPAQWRRLAERLAWINFRMSQFDQAHHLANLVLQDHQVLEADDPITLASLYNTVGGVYWARTRYQEAIESVQKSLALYRSLNYDWGSGIALANLGILHFSTGKWVEAIQYLEQADELQYASGFDPERATNLKNLGEILISLGRFGPARTRLEASREISIRLGMDLLVIHAELGLGRLSILEERPDEAAVHLELARQRIDLSGENADLQAQSLNLQAMLESANGDDVAALRSAQDAFQIVDNDELQDEKAESLRLMGNAHCRLKQFEMAKAELEQSLETSLKAENLFSQGHTLTDLALLYLNWGRDQPERSQELSYLAEVNLDKAIEILDNLNAHHELQRALAARVQLVAPPVETIPGSEQRVRDQLEQLRIGLGLQTSEWFQAIIMTVLLSPRQDANEESLFEAIHLLKPGLGEIILEHGGQLQEQNEAIVGIFGVPVAREDDPVQAVEAAIQVLNVYNHLLSQTSLPLTLRVGIAMGKIIAGKLKLQASQELVAAGEPLQTSLAIASGCSPAHAWVTQPVHNATAFRFDYSPVASPISAQFPGLGLFELVGLREQILPVRGLIGLKTPFIGRQSELNVMQRFSEDLLSGKGGLIWVEGDPGIGKSRLMKEFSNQSAALGIRVWQGTCTSRSSELAYSPFADMLSKLLTIMPDMAPEQIYQKIDQRMAEWPDDLNETRPFIEILVGVQPSLPSLERIVSLEPEQLRRQTFVALHRVISRLAGEKPLLIILDDLQWIDSLSADLLLYLSHLVVSNPVLFLCAQRMGEAGPYEAILQRIRSMHPDQYQRLLVQPLNLDERRQMLDQFLASTELPEPMRLFIIQQSGGNPYFIEEFVRMLIEQDYLRMVHGQLEVNPDLKIDALTIPTSLETLIRSRVDSLPATVRNILQVAAVIGQRFTTAVLKKVADSEDIQPYLNLLQIRGMLTEADEAGFLEFTHPMIEAIVYNTVLKAQRKILHQRTAAALETVWTGHLWEHAEELAYHYSRAELYPQTLHYLILAGERAATRHANEAAVTFFERASEMFSLVPEAGTNLRWRITRGLGEVYQFIGNYEASLAALRAGEDLASDPSLSDAQRAAIYRLQGDTAFKKGDPEAAIASLIEALSLIIVPSNAESEAELARIYTRLAWSYFIQANPEQAKQAVALGESYARQAGDMNALAAAENLLGGIYWRQRQLDQAVSHTHQAMDYWQQIGYSWGVAVTLSNLGILEILAGNWDEAFQLISRSLKMRQEMGDVEGMAVNNLNLGFLSLDQGRFEPAESYFRSSLAIARPFHISYPATNSCLGLARTLIYLNRSEEVMAVLQEGKQLANEINARDVLSDLHRTEAELYLLQGDIQKAFEQANTALHLAEESGDDLVQANAWHILARIHFEQDQFDPAWHALECARQALDRAPDILEAARLEALQGRLHLAQGHKPQAEDCLQKARASFTQLGATYDLEQLEAIPH